MAQNTEYDIIVIGGGASGMMAAICAARAGTSVLILEKNKTLGNKLSISGGGRCNITNTNEDKNAFMSAYGDMGKFLHTSFARFSVKDTLSFFEKIGVPIVTEARNRAFPVSQSAQDVTDKMKAELRVLGVRMQTGEAVKNISIFKGKIKKIETNREEYSAKKYILATGGLSHPETGSTGDGFGFLKKAGHTIFDPSPSIVPLAVKEHWVKSLSGTSLDNMSITFFLDGKKKFKKTGKILFTHFGVSGPLILNSSQKVGDLIQGGSVTATIDLYPDIVSEQIEKNIIKLFDSYKNKDFKNILPEIVPRGMAETFLYLSKIDPDKKVHSITKEERKKIVDSIKSLPLTITGLMGFDRAVVADGGVDLKEVDTKTMKSKIIDNLYVTGDLLHINRPSGGFSLQLCWTTGFIAGTEAAT